MCLIDLIPLNKFFLKVSSLNFSLYFTEHIFLRLDFYFYFDNFHTVVAGISFIFFFGDKISLFFFLLIDFDFKSSVFWFLELDGIIGIYSMTDV